MNELPTDRVEDLFDRAVVLDPGERAAFLEAACTDDPALRAEVESLLAFDAGITDGRSGTDMLKSPLVRSPRPTYSGPVGTMAAAWPDDHQVRLGRYRIRRRIAEGGMGAVYEAEQDSPRRFVALKVIRPGLASPDLLKRFAHEAQILGRLHHPGIAQVYEAGLADDGQPFFAMEFIRGLPLDEYARRHALDLRARVTLLALACDAVQHAHDRGVIHRDLKPANILVEENGQPRVLDFGIARTTGADLLTAAGLTRTGMLLGTPSYMSPEQVAADPAAIDHRADVYALGVILFELAADRLPLQLEDRPLAETARLILEQDPPRLGSIHAELRGDVETIAAKALEKEPSRRYASSAELALDLRRWLAHEPIRARPPSTLYHLRQFARRNKALVGGVIATGAALFLGLVGTSLFAVAEARQRNQAELNARAANAEKREALYQAYRARIAAAAAALQNHDVLDASRQLDNAPEDIRGWEWRHLHDRLDDSSAVIPLSSPGAGYLLAAPDRLLVAAMTSAGLHLSDPAGGESRTLPIRVEGNRPDSVTITRRGLLAVVWVANTAFDLLDEAGHVLRHVEIPEIGSPHPVLVSMDGTRLATFWAWKGTTRLAVLDATSGERKALCDGHPGGVRRLAFSPDGTHLASVGDDRTARVWDAATGMMLATCRGHEAKILNATFSADGTRLATTSSDGTVRQWDATTGREIETPYERHSGEVLAAAYSPDGQWVASAGTDRTIRVWRAAGRQDVAILYGHTGGVIGLTFDPRGRRLASLSGNSFLRYPGDDTVRVWDVEPQATLPALKGHTENIFAVACSPNGRWIASGGADSTVRLWDAATGEPCATLHHPGGVWSLAFSPDSLWLASASSADNRLRIWDVATGRLRSEIPIPVGTLFYVIVSPDGSRVAATANGGPSKNYHLHVCDVASGAQLYTAEGWALAYSPDGRWMAATAEDDRTVLLLDARTHETVARFPGHEDWVFKMTFSPDSRWLASCSGDRTVRLWPIDGGPGRVLRGHTDEVQALAFHPDGTRLASGGEDRTVWLWDLARGEAVARLQGHTSFIWSLAFSPDGATLASGSGDSTVRLWDTAPLRMRHQARREAEALRPEAERLVGQLWRQKRGPAEIAASLRADPVLSEPLREAALRALLHQSQTPVPVLGNSTSLP